MAYQTWCVVLGIGFWTLSALLTVCFIIWVYLQVQYYAWDLKDREQESLVKAFVQALNDKDFDPMQADVVQYEQDENEEN